MNLFYCPKCGDDLFEMAHTIDHRDNNTIKATEWYKCFECRKIFLRHVSYEKTYEEWEEKKE